MFVRFLGNPITSTQSETSLAIQQNYITSMVAKYVKDGPIPLTTFALLHKCTMLIKSLYYDEVDVERKGALSWLLSVIKENPVTDKVYDIYM